ncbi:MAG: DUF3455 domain-containing protein [Betaproteobacteria bacterium]
MKNCIAPKRPTTHRVLSIAGAAAFVAAFMVLLSQPAHAHRIKAPSVPSDIEVPPGNKAFLVGHGVGTQNYICVPSASGFAFTLFTPQATLFGQGDKQQVTTHYFSPNPFENGTVRATWESSRDTSTVWGQVIQPSSDPNFVAPNAIPWLLVKVVGAAEGPAGGDRLTDTTYIQRLNTVGGNAPATGCANSADVGAKAFEPYTADYFFYFSPDADDRR